MAVTGNLEQIRTKVRRITGRPSSNQLSDNDLDDYINDFYTYDLVTHLKLWNLKTTASPLVPTTPGNDRILLAGVTSYEVDINTYVNIEPPFYVGGYEIQYFQDRRTFLTYFPHHTVVQTLTTADGSAGPYNGIINNIPILFDSLFITVVNGAGDTLVANSTSTGVLTGDVLAGGTIDLTTGVVTNLTWTSAIPAGNLITAQTLNYREARPRAVLYQDDILTFYPVPDVPYEISCSVYYNPTSLAVGEQPEIRQWWNLIALGASIKIFTDNLDIENIAKIQPLFDQALRLAERRTLKQLSTQRVATIYDYRAYSPFEYFVYSG